MTTRIKNILGRLRFWGLKFLCGDLLDAQGCNYFQNGSLKLAKDGKFELKEKNVFDRNFDIEAEVDLQFPIMNYPIIWEVIK